MGNRNYFIDREVRAMTQLVSSVIQKRSSLNYQINQLKLALNSKKTCIETKKLRDLKLKNAELVVDIKETGEILEKIKRIKYKKPCDKDLSENLNCFAQILTSKGVFLMNIEEELNLFNESLKELRETAEEKTSYLKHLQEKAAKINHWMEKTQKNSQNIEKLNFEIQELKQKNQETQTKRLEVTEKHFRMLASKKLKRKQTLVIPKLTTSAFLLRSKLLLKSEMIKQINELKKDQSAHLEEINKQHKLVSLEGSSNVQALNELERRKSRLRQKISEYQTEIKSFCTSPISPILPTRTEDSLYTEIENSFEDSVL